MSIFGGRNYPVIDLDGAVVVVTGGGRGIGRATAELFAARGATVCIGDLDRAVADEAAAEIGARAYTVDVASAESWRRFVDAVLADCDRIDVLINNAGVMPLGGFLEESDATSRMTMNVNVWGPLHGMRMVLPGMVERGSGHIVNVASMAGKLPVPGMAVYNASKFGAVGLSASVRAEFAPAGVSVSTVLPSAVRTGLSSGVPLGGGMPTVDPEDVADAIVRTLDHRRAETAVPGYLAGWDLIDAVVPERLLDLGRRLIDDRRALTAVDPVGRADYDRRLARQSRTP
ncbi:MULTISPECIES: SDR family oxidoreductase [Rhodococcus]|uniref:Short chain dehydrogenase n=1 Tax=Rhodococcus opacus RKJ300 = JCM 13270 TaxID=1165867 RepID=I0W5S2_RHOOP|nr:MULTISPECIES: SDR family oxidoreductase [Rhodococcus]EID71738.1 short chain dehydrogenase [Rhodococcus opacus RKJ300 = JCM 13270]QQZ14900.1 SDR family oxidoreductase [Rhodococcus sp. 21391]